MESAEKSRIAEREVGLKERKLEDDLNARADTTITTLMGTVQSTIQASMAAGATPDAIKKTIAPLMESIGSLAQKSGRDPMLYARQAETMLATPAGREPLKSPIGQMIADYNQLQRAGADPVTLRQMQQRIDREAKGDDKNAFTNEHQLRAEHTNLVKPIREVESAFSKIQAVMKNTPEGSPAGDLAILYSFHKILDPRSQTTEGEFRNAQTARSILEGLGLNWNDIAAVWTNKGLTRDQRQDFLNQATQLHSTAGRERANLDQRYRDLAKRHNIDPEAVAPRSAKGGIAPPAAAIDYLRQNSRDPAKVKAFEEKYGRSAEPYID